MDLARMSNKDRLRLCKRYFYLGFLALPFLWFVNSIWFGTFLYNFETYRRQRRQARRHSPPQQNNATSQQQQNPDLRQQSQPMEPIDDDTKQNLKEIRRIVIYSTIGSIVWIIIAVAWITVFQILRPTWGEFGDSLSFNIPRGIP